MRRPLFIVDAFADKPFTGNSAAVVLLDRPITDSLMQSIAAEMNHAETAFVLEENDGFRLRWFSPSTEVALCGHATLAAASVLFDELVVKSESVKFDTLSGHLHARRGIGTIQLDFPSLSTTQDLDGLLDGVTNTLSQSPREMLRSRFDALAVFEDETSIRELQIDFDALKREDVRGLIVTAKSSSNEYDFISRFFAPAVGVPEDPATGSAHCCLATYWSPILGKTKMVGYQASSRGAVVGVEVRNDRVILEGKCQRIVSGEIQLPE